MADTLTIAAVLARWDSGEGKPYKGSLIDWNAYGGDGDAPPADIGCMCAQGQMRADRADGARQRELAAAYGVSRSHVRDIVNRKKWRHV